MPQNPHWLILARREDALEKVYRSFPSGLSLTLAQDSGQFKKLAQRFAFSHFIFEPEAEEGRRAFDIFHDIKIRQPAATFFFLLDAPTAHRVSAWDATTGGWAPLFPPYPADLIPHLMNRLAPRPLIYYHHSPDAAKSPPAASPGIQARTLGDITTALAKNPGSLVVLETGRPDNPLATMLRQILQADAAVKVLLLFDHPSPDIVLGAFRHHGWCPLTPPQGPGDLMALWQTAQKPSRAQPQAERLLVVDDEPNLLSFLVDTLSEEGYAVDGVASGQKGLEAMRQNEYHAALVDFQLGDTTGLNLAREFRQMDENIPILLMTAHASLDMAVKAIQADVYDYLIKPVQSGALKRSIRKALETRRLAVENKILLADLQKANGELNRLNELKTKFLSIVTHDLRTPLTSIKGYAQILNMQKELAADQKRHFLEVIAKEADHLGLLINDLMDFVSIEAGRLRVERVPIQLKDLLDNLRDRMEISAKRLEIRFALDIRLADFPPLTADERRLEQVLTNLIANAFKHTPAAGQVTLTVEKQGPSLRFQVTDTGEGIPPGDLQRVFEQFYQVESHTSKREGIGLGLTIAKEIVQAHGGTIGAHSEGPGKGATFYFTLPLGKTV